jgi:ABC-type sugar transport system substrate-binding protein
MHRVFQGLFIAVAWGWLGAACAASVVFLSPGPASDGYWSSYARFMKSAADKLGMSLTVRFSDRDTRQLLVLAREELKGPNRPDYLVFSNELNVAPEILRLSEGSGVKLFAVNNTLTADQIRILGDLRHRYPDFLGSLIANDEDAGYLTAKNLIVQYSQRSDGRAMEMLAFSGTNTTPVSLKREKGMYRALAEHPEVRLRQIALGGWRRDRALEQARLLLKRYPAVNLIWTANDLMAFGAMDAVRENGGEPGKDVLFSSVNWSPTSLEAMTQGRLSVIVGGHFTIGGLAMVILHDYDVADPATRGMIGAREAKVMRMIKPDDVKKIIAASKYDDFGIDVRMFSLQGKAPGSEYEFTLKNVVR